MRLLVFGATGGTGHELIEFALAQGHDVTAFARNPAKLAVEHANLESVRGDVTDFASVVKAARDRDAVLCVIGAGARRSTFRNRGDAEHRPRHGGGGGAAPRSPTSCWSS